MSANSHNYLWVIVHYINEYCILNTWPALCGASLQNRLFDNDLEPDSNKNSMNDCLTAHRGWMFAHKEAWQKYDLI